MFNYVKMENNETPEKCATCGYCCKQYPGAYHPEQFDDLSKDKIIEMIKSKQYAIDAYIGYNDMRESVYNYGYFIRPFGSNEEYNKTLGQYRRYIGCVNLTEKGCALKFEDRPYACQRLTSDICNSSETDSKLAIADAWSRYHSVLNDVVEELNIQLTPYVVLNDVDDFLLGIMSL